MCGVVVVSGGLHSSSKHDALTRKHCTSSLFLGVHCTIVRLNVLRKGNSWHGCDIARVAYNCYDAHGECATSFFFEIFRDTH